MASLRLLATSGILQRKEPLWVLAKDACNCSSSSDKFTCREGGKEGGREGGGGGGGGMNLGWCISMT